MKVSNLLKQFLTFDQKGNYLAFGDCCLKSVQFAVRIRGTVCLGDCLYPAVLCVCVCVWCVVWWRNGRVDLFVFFSTIREGGHSKCRRLAKANPLRNELLPAKDELQR